MVLKVQKVKGSKVYDGFYNVLKLLFFRKAVKSFFIFIDASSNAMVLLH